MSVLSSDFLYNLFTVLSFLRIKYSYKIIYYADERNDIIIDITENSYVKTVWGHAVEVSEVNPDNKRFIYYWSRPNSFVRDILWNTVSGATLTAFPRQKCLSFIFDRIMLALRLLVCLLDYNKYRTNVSRVQQRCGGIYCQRTSDIEDSCTTTLNYTYIRTSY